jgi:hypothetical protein
MNFIVKLCTGTAIAFMVLTAFTGKDPETFTIKPGKYQLCGGDTLNPSVELVLRSDSTFRYYSTMEANGTEDCDGKWSIDKNYVELYDYPDKVRIPYRWKILEGGDCLRGSLTIGMGFMNICRTSYCSTLGKE